MRSSQTLVLIVAGAAIAATLSGCSAGSPPTASAPARTAPTTAPASAAAPATVAVQPAVPSTPAVSAPSTTATPAAKPKPPVGKPLSAASKRYAKELGGTSHQGETLYFIIGRSFKTEAAATKALKQARPYFGDMQDYFVVQRSDNFSEMRPGWWVLVEGYRKASNAKNQRAFAQRAFTSAYVKKATVKTADPIPVYEDLVDGTMD